MTADPPLADALCTAFGPDARVTQLDTLVGDASTRLYQRARLAHAPVASAIVMRLPPDALTRSDELAKASSGDELPFSNMLRAANARGVRVPALYADLTRAGNFTVLLEDLGDQTLFTTLVHTPRATWSTLYERAVDLLCEWQRSFAERDTSCVAYGRRFDRGLLRWELDHFREWGVDAWRGPIASDALRRDLDAEFDRLADDVAALPTTLVHRDWQSKNLMVLGNGSLAVIDFQDALVGPRPYDLVALLCDSYVGLEPDEQVAWLARYVARAGLSAAERDAFERAFWTQAVQRKLKDAGRFVFIDRVRKNQSFLEYIPQSVRYVHRALVALGDERASLHALLAQIAPDWFGERAAR
jgi:aminoglycoside/choline kinase family phosphotransferase